MLKKKLIKFVADNDKLWFILRCLKRMHDKDFVFDVNHLYNNRFMYRFKEYGEENKGKILYLIEIKDNKYGFCAILRNVLQECLIGGDELGFFPVVKMSDKCFYAEDKGFLGTDNPWEYYFKQPKGISLDEFKRSYRTTEATEDNLVIIKERYKGFGYEVSEEYINTMADIWKRYIFLREELQVELMNQISELYGKERILGVHARGSDFKQGVLNHPNAVPMEEYFKNIDELLPNYDKVFIATEDSEYLDEFIKRYGDKVIYHKSIVRSRYGKNPVLENISNPVERANPSYMLGVDVLLDLLSLGEADGIISGLSIVPLCSRIYKRSRDKKHKDDRVLNSGFCNENGITLDEWGKSNKVPKSNL